MSEGGGCVQTLASSLQTPFPNPLPAPFIIPVLAPFPVYPQLTAFQFINDVKYEGNYIIK